MTAIVPKNCDLVLILSLIRQESGFNPHAVSPAGAKGLMQLMPATWNEWVKKLGFKTPNVFNPIQNITVGCAELNRQLEHFGKLDVALTAFNWGGGNMSRLIASAGTDDLDKLRTYQPNEVRGMPKEAQQYALKIFRHYNDPQTLEYIDDYKALVN